MRGRSLPACPSCRSWPARIHARPPPASAWRSQRPTGPVADALDAAAKIAAEASAAADALDNLKRLLGHRTPNVEVATTPPPPVPPQPPSPPQQRELIAATSPSPPERHDAVAAPPRDAVAAPAPVERYEPIAAPPRFPAEDAIPRGTASAPPRKDANPFSRRHPSRRVRRRRECRFQAPVRSRWPRCRWRPCTTGATKESVSSCAASSWASGSRSSPAWCSISS